MTSESFIWLDARLHARIAERLNQVPMVIDGLAYVLDSHVEYVTTAERVA